MVQAEFVLGGLEGVLDRPAVPLNRDKGFDRGLSGAPSAEKGQLCVRPVAPDQQASRPQPLGTVHVFVCAEMGEREVGPVVKPRPLRAVTC